jgi:hypothetical protein
MMNSPLTGLAGMKAVIGLLLAGAASAYHTETPVPDDLYRNDEFGFVLPVPADYAGCTSFAGAPLGGSHVLSIVPRSEGCASLHPFPAIDLYAKWAVDLGQTAETAGQAICALRYGVPSRLKFGADTLYRCMPVKGEVPRYYLVRPVTRDGTTRPIEIQITLTGFGAEIAELDEAVGGILAAARFLAE